jgi:glycosyltransferase involved in cell wall biosynthesis
MPQMNRIHFSVVTVVKNDLSGLKKTRKSIEGQTFTNWTHIIIDGGSSLKTLNFLRGLPTHNTSFISEADEGIYDAMNKGWEKALKSSYVIYLNARDVFSDNLALFSAAEALYGSKEPEWGCTTHEEISEDGAYWICKRVADPSLSNQLFATGYRSHQSVVMKSSFIRELGGFDTRLKVASDWDLIAKAIINSKPAIWEHSLGRFELGGMSADNMLQAHLELKDLRRKYLNQSLKQRIMDDIWCAYNLRYLGFTNWASRGLGLLSNKNKPKTRNLQFFKFRTIRLNLFFFTVNVLPNWELFFRIKNFLSFRNRLQFRFFRKHLMGYVNKKLGIEF